MISTASLASQQWQVEYPESDGKPMAETDVHRRELINAILTLQERYEEEEDVYIAGDLLLYYEEGNPQAAVAPDVFFVRGVPRHDRRVYKLWEEGVMPQMVIEFSSRSTCREDQGRKRDLYLELGVEEYFLMDPLEEYLHPPFQGFRRGGGDFMPILPSPEGAMMSQVLRLELKPVGEALRFVDPDTHTVLPTPMERAKQEAAWRKQEAARAERATLQAAQEAAWRKQEAARAEWEAARAEREAARAEPATMQMEREAAWRKQEATRAEQEAERAEQEATRAAQATTRAEQETERAKHEAARAEQATTRAEQATTRAEQEAARAEQATTRADQEAARAEQEATARQEMALALEKADAEARRMRELLDRAGIQDR